MVTSLRLRVLPSLPPDAPQEASFQISGGYLQWKLEDDVAWTNLIAVSEITGPEGDPGPNIELQSNGTYLQWRVVGAGSWTNLVSLASITGPSPSLIAGTVTTLAAGSAATLAVIDNGDGSYSINLGIPQGMPSGGTAGQIMAKASGSDYDAEWISSLRIVSDRAGLSALSGSVSPLVYLSEEQALLEWSASDFSTIVSSDTEEGEAVAPDSDATGASGAWFYIGGQIESAKRFGADPDSVTNGFDNLAAFNAYMTALSRRGGGDFYLPKGDYLVKLPSGSPIIQPIIHTPSNVRIISDGNAWIHSQGFFGGFNSGLFTNVAGAENIKFEGVKFRAAQGVSFTGTISSGSNVFSSVSSTAGLVVGMPIEGPQMPPRTYITSLSGGVTVSDNARANVTDGTFIGHWPGGSFISIMDVPGFQMRDVELGETWGRSGGDPFRTRLRVTDFYIENTRLSYQTKDHTSWSSYLSADEYWENYVGEDGIHLFGGSGNGVITGTRGTAGDDPIALNIENDSYVDELLNPYWDRDIVDITMSDNHVDTFAAQCTRVLIAATATTGTIKRCSTRGLRGTPNSIGGNVLSSGLTVKDLSLRKGIIDFTASDCVFDCSQSAIRGAEIISGENIALDRVTVHSSALTAFFFSGVDRAWLCRSSAADGTTTASTVGAMFQDSCIDARVIDSYFDGAASHGVIFNGVTRGNISGNTSNNNGGYGVVLAGATTRVSVTGNGATGNASGAIYEVSPADYNAFTGNHSPVTTVGANSVSTGNLTS